VRTASSNFDPRQAIEGLFGYVKDIAANSLKTVVKTQPDQARVEAAVLAALESGTKTAAQIVKAISLAAGGAWMPTDGQVNKSLARLLETELVSAKTKGDRKSYSLTKKGESALEEAREKMAEAPSVSPASKMNMNFNWMTCDPKFLTAASKLPPVMLDIAQTGTKEQQMKAAAILDKARHDLHVVLAEK
jgi:DNA-binding PadR family transcriptional regulator